MSQIKRRGLMLILSAPSGTGKTTLANKVISSDTHISFSVSCTTRKKRANELEGKDYFFYSRNEFISKIKKGDFLEYAEIMGEYYGTPKKTVLNKLDDGEDVLFDIDWQGHRQLSSIARKDVTSIFLLPPSKTELFHRLCNRKQDNPEIIQERMKRSNEEISHWYEYDYIIINRNIDQSITKILSILKSERLKKERRTGLPEFIGTLLNENLKC